MWKHGKLTRLRHQTLCRYCNQEVWLFTSEHNTFKCNEICLYFYIIFIFTLNFYWQETVCNPQALLNCVKNIKTANNTCIKSCNGLMITGYSKQEFDKNALKTIENTVNAYKNYKKWFKFPQGIKGSIRCFFT